MEVHLIDGTYELFRHYYGAPSARDDRGQEVAAVRGVLASVLGLIKHGATHVGVATDHVIESFRNGLWRGYKTSEGIEPNLLAQFPLLEEALTALGVVVWPMVEFEADDALASAAATRRCSFARSRRCARICRCLRKSTSCGGRATRRRFPPWRKDWTRRSQFARRIGDERRDGETDLGFPPKLLRVLCFLRTSV